jgi:hypothetical protein
MSIHTLIAELKVNWLLNSVAQYKGKEKTQNQSKHSFIYNIMQYNFIALYYILYLLFMFSLMMAINIYSSYMYIYSRNM